MKKGKGNPGQRPGSWYQHHGLLMERTVDRLDGVTEAQDILAKEFDGGIRPFKYDISNPALPIIGRRESARARYNASEKRTVGTAELVAELNEGMPNTTFRARTAEADSFKIVREKYGNVFRLLVAVRLDLDPVLTHERPEATKVIDYAIGLPFEWRERLALLPVAELPFSSFGLAEAVDNFRAQRPVYIEFGPAELYRGRR